MSTVLTDEMRERAVEIADESMIELLRAHAVALDDDLERFSLSAESGEEVFALVDADEPIREAFEWLSQRGLAHLEKDEHGEIIILDLEEA